MRLLSQMNDGQAWSLSVHSPIRGTRTDPALSRERARWKSVLLDQRPSLLTLRRRAFRLCSNDSSVLCRCPTPRRRARGPYGLSLLPPLLHTGLARGTNIVIALMMSPNAGFSGLRIGLSLNPLRCLRLRFLVPFRVDSGRQGIQPAEKCDNLPYMIVGHCFIVVPL